MAQVKDKSASNLVKDNFYPIVAIVVILVGVFLVINSPRTDNKTENTSATASSTLDSETSKPKNLAHRGQEGRTALAILKEVATIETSGEGEMAFVTGINGYKPDVNKEFWALYVNGKQSEVGAGVYVTKNDDVIEWRLEEIKAQ